LLSIGSKLDQHRGFGLGFDFLRISLALGIVAWHSFGISRDGVFVDGVKGVWFLGYGMLFLFFSLSGFLIAGSAQRLSLMNFLVNRGLRIFPALIVEVLLSAFVLGLLLSSLAPAEYLSSTGTYRYLTNIFGLMNFHLPGLFEKNPVSVVNYSLWTVPYEFACYGIISTFIAFGLLRSPLIVISVGVFVALTGVVLVGVGISPVQSTPGLINKLCYLIFTDRGSRLFVAFTFGIAAYLLRYRIPYTLPLFILSIACCALVAGVGPSGWLNYPLLNVLVSAPLTYIMAYIGASNVPMPKALHDRDYSYGIYLYAMPIQQVMIQMFPSVRDPVAQLFLALPATILFAAFSWHCIEKPILRQRKRFSFVAKVRGVVEASSQQGTPNPSPATRG
jgi:peptidoglycan/LPS O-acetylase OafA/YrhL